VEGIRGGWGAGMCQCATSVPFWHTTPASLPVPRSNHYPKTPAPVNDPIARGVHWLARPPAHSHRPLAPASATGLSRQAAGYRSATNSVRWAQTFVRLLWLPCQADWQWKPVQPAAGNDNYSAGLIVGSRCSRHQGLAANRFRPQCAANLEIASVLLRGLPRKRWLQRGRAQLSAEGAASSCPQRTGLARARCAHPGVRPPRRRVLWDHEVSKPLPASGLHRTSAGRYSRATQPLA
jgi:hypothetical protein